jgi:hypothetical protein
VSAIKMLVRLATYGAFLEARLQGGRRSPKEAHTEAKNFPAGEDSQPLPKLASGRKSANLAA